MKPSDDEEPEQNSCSVGAGGGPLEIGSAADDDEQKALRIGAVVKASASQKSTDQGDV